MISRQLIFKHLNSPRTGLGLVRSGPSQSWCGLGTTPLGSSPSTGSRLESVSAGTPSTSTGLEPRHLVAARQQAPGNSQSPASTPSTSTRLEPRHLVAALHRLQRSKPKEGYKTAKHITMEVGFISLNILQQQSITMSSQYLL